MWSPTKAPSAASTMISGSDGMPDTAKTAAAMTTDSDGSNGRNASRIASARIAR